MSNPTCIIKVTPVNVPEWGNGYNVFWHPEGEADDIVKSVFFFRTEQEAIAHAQRQISRGWTGESTRFTLEEREARK